MIKGGHFALTLNISYKSNYEAKSFIPYIAHSLTEIYPGYFYL